MGAGAAGESCGVFEELQLAQARLKARVQQFNARLAGGETDWQLLLILIAAVDADVAGICVSARQRWRNRASMRASVPCGSNGGEAFDERAAGAGKLLRVAPAPGDLQVRGHGSVGLSAIG